MLILHWLHAFLSTSSGEKGVKPKGFFDFFEVNDIFVYHHAASAFYIWSVHLMLIIFLVFFCFSIQEWTIKEAQKQHTIQTKQGPAKLHQELR